MHFQKKMVSELKCGDCRCIAVKTCDVCDTHLCLRHSECPLCEKQQQKRAKKWITYRSSYPMSFIYYNLPKWLKFILLFIVVSLGVSFFSFYSEQYASFMSVIFCGFMFYVFKTSLTTFDVYLEIKDD